MLSPSKRMVDAKPVIKWCDSTRGCPEICNTHSLVSQLLSAWKLMSALLSRGDKETAA